MGTSSVSVWIPRRSASGGARGPRPKCFRVSVWAGVVVVGIERAAAAVAHPFAAADAKEEVRFQADGIELDSAPAARLLA